MRSNQCEQLGGPGSGVAASDRSSSWPIMHQVLRAGQVLVDRGVLAGEADRAAHLLGVADDVVAADPGDAGVGAQQGGEDADGGGLAGAVRAEHAEHGALAGGQVDAGEGLGVAEALGQPFGFDGVVDSAVVMVQECAGAAGTARTRAGSRWQALAACSVTPRWHALSAPAS